MSNKPVRTFNLQGKFKERAVEREYRIEHFNRTKKSLALSFVLVGIVYLLFFIPNLFTVGIPKALPVILTIRLSIFVVLAAVSAYAFLGKNYRVCFTLLTLAELIFLLSYFLIVYISGQFDFQLKTLDLIILITLIFLMPNNHAANITVSIILALGFYGFILLLEPEISIRKIIPTTVYVILIYLVNCIGSLKINVFIRRQYTQQKELNKLIDNDSLTGIASRVQFNRLLSQRIEAARRTGEPLTLTVFDIDDFKHINDTYGHFTGDNVLADLTGLLSKHLKGDELFSRWGGEEFTLINSLPLKDTVKHVSELKELIGRSSFSDGVRLSCSFGVTAFRQQDDQNVFFDRADKLLYNAKTAGKNALISDE